MLLTYKKPIVLIYEGLGQIRFHEMSLPEKDADAMELYVADPEPSWKSEMRSRGEHMPFLGSIAHGMLKRDVSPTAYRAQTIRAERLNSFQVLFCIELIKDLPLSRTVFIDDRLYGHERYHPELERLKTHRERCVFKKRINGKWRLCLIEDDGWKHEILYSIPCKESSLHTKERDAYRINEALKDDNPFTPVAKDEDVWKGVYGND